MSHKTTVQIDKTVMMSVKLAAIQQDISYSAYIEMAVKRCIEQDKQGDLFKGEPE
jgi:predicted HicB family RNase H-like nuclease